MESCPQRSRAWFMKRKNHITASMMSAVCNANPYESRSTALMKKTGQKKPFIGNAATEHGTKYEMEAILKYEKITSSKCLEFGLLESINENESFLAGSPDGITSEGRLIEVKCPFRRTPTKKIPDYYKYQVQFLMHILRLPDCDFIQYVPENYWAPEIFIVTNIKYDPYFWNEKFPMLCRFWDEVNIILKYKKNNAIVLEIKDDEEVKPKKKPEKEIQCFVDIISSNQEVNLSFLSFDLKPNKNDCQIEF